MASVKAQWILTLLLCLPCTIATTALWIVSRGSASGTSEVSLVRSLIDNTAVSLFMVATYGPLLALAAVPIVIKLSRTSNQPLLVVTAWVVLVLALVAGAYFHSTLTWNLELP